jgi:[ribosomal protein S5]-alanine N-acetyltransferase
MTSTFTTLTTLRLVLRRTDEAFAAPLADFLHRNRVHLDPWSPPASAQFFTEAGQLKRLQQVLQSEQQGGDCAWWLFAADDPQRLIGNARLSQVSRGPFCNAMLGYSLDAACEGQGLMHEALRAVIDNAFGPQFSGGAPLHRIQANARTENKRSLKLLERLGFAREGLAPEYLFIDGAWRDHVLCALRNPAWPATKPPS